MHKWAGINSETNQANTTDATTNSKVEVPLQFEQ